MLEDIIKQLLEFRDKRDWKQFHTPEALAKSISIEAAELLECFQWSDKFDKQKLQEELADIFIYAIFLAKELDFDIETIIKEKLEINRKNYPVKKSKGSYKKAVKNK